MKISIVLGTRPEIIKMSPIIKLLEKKQMNFFIIHSNQHYSKNMDHVFFEQLELPQPKYNLDVGSSSHAEQTGNILIGVEKILNKENPDIVLVQGDTNTVLAGALAAAKLQIKVGHVEAGLRSYDHTMPEEINRILTDHCSDILFAPTKIQQNILLNEGISINRIFVVGNTIVDAVYKYKKIAEKKSNILKELNLLPKEYVLVTAHRSLNVDSAESLKKLVFLIDSINDFIKSPIVFPIHPRTCSKLLKYNLEFRNDILIDPVGYIDFLKLEMNANLVITDSGGVQEEACVLQVPCITIRENTERPETVKIGANKIVGLNIKKLKNAICYYQKHENKWINPFGDGTASKKILEVLQSSL